MGGLSANICQKLFSFAEHVALMSHECHLATNTHDSAVISRVQFFIFHYPFPLGSVIDATTVSFMIVSQLIVMSILTKKRRKDDCLIKSGVCPPNAVGKAEACIT